MAAFVVLCGACAGSALAAHGGAWPLQERIDEIAAKGGGTLVLTAGVYRTGAIFFKPGVNLHLEKGATIIGVDEAEGYDMRETRIEGETCIARVIAEKDAALADLDNALVGRSFQERRGGLGTGRPTSCDGLGTDCPDIGERFDWLRAHLKVSRALDGALWRYFHLRECAKEGRTDADDLAGIEADFETVRSLSKDVCSGFGSPIPLMRGIRDKARQLHSTSPCF